MIVKIVRDFNVRSIFWSLDFGQGQKVPLFTRGPVIIGFDRKSRLTRLLGASW